MSAGHYENFPVASILVPARLRPAVLAIYRFARSADDIADEGDAPAAARLAVLARYGAALDAIGRGETPSFGPFPELAAAIRGHQLPLEPLHALLSAFAQDVTVKRYATYALLGDYCARSANPVGRLLLALYGAGTSADLAHSDAICTALQLANFWQDVAGDWQRGRVYLPAEDMARFGITEAAIDEARVDDAWRELMRFQTERTRALLESGRPLVRALPHRLALELAGVLAGGHWVLDAIDAAPGRRVQAPAAAARARLADRGMAGAVSAPLPRRALRHPRMSDRVHQRPHACIMTPDEYCQQKAAQSGSSFYYSFLFLPPPRRRAITALYAFCREVDDVVDDAGEGQVARTKLAWWRTEVDAMFAGTPTHPVTRALQPFLAEYRIGQSNLQAVIDGMMMDLDHDRYLDFTELERYCHCAAGVVGLMSAGIFGYTQAATLDYAHDLGIAFQLTNIIRDVGEDGRRGRIYLPQDELRTFGVAPSTLLRGESTPGFAALMRHQVDRARQWYGRALTGLPAADRKAQRPGLIMAAIYRTLLEEIERDGYAVLNQRIALTPVRKFWIAWKTARAT